MPFLSLSLSQLKTQAPTSPTDHKATYHSDSGHSYFLETETPFHRDNGVGGAWLRSTNLLTFQALYANLAADQAAGDSADAAATDRRVDSVPVGGSAGEA